MVHEVEEAKPWQAVHCRARRRDNSKSPHSYPVLYSSRDSNNKSVYSPKASTQYFSSRITFGLLYWVLRSRVLYTQRFTSLRSICLVGGEPSSFMLNTQSSTIYPLKRTRAPKMSPHLTLRIQQPTLLNQRTHLDPHFCILFRTQFRSSLCKNEGRNTPKPYKEFRNPCRKDRSTLGK